MLRSIRSLVVCIALLTLPISALAQITTGTVSGRVVDSSGGVIPNASVTLISETRGTKSAALTTNSDGDYVFPNVAPDTYTVEVVAASFKVVKRTGVVVSGADRVGVPAITLVVGGTTETVTVAAEATLVQSQSGERSFAVSTAQIEALPIARGNFTNMIAFTPGVKNGGFNQDGARLGGASQDNLMMDGISAVDTGNNGQMVNMNIESIGEVKILTQGYQAEYGRSSGLQITAVTKSGTNQFHGSGYSVFTDSDWNKNSWVSQMNGDAKAKSSQQTYGYTVGGPVRIPKVFDGRNKLFFFYAHEFQPTIGTTNSGNVIRYRLPSALERAGNFSQSRDNNGALLPALIDYQNGAPFPNQIIPTGRLYAPGVAVLNRYPLPTLEQAPGTNYNYQANAATYNQLTQQPAVKIDYQLSDKLRFSGKYSAQRQRAITIPGLLPGFNDAYTPHPYITNPAITANYMISPSTFIEGTYGSIKNELAGGNENGILTNPESNRLQSLKDFPMLYPDAGVLPTGSYGYKMMELTKPAFWDGKSVNLPPVFSWGGRIGAAPPQQRYPGWLNINRTQDVAISLTHIAGRHTIKGGYYLNHSYKAQNANVSWQGSVNFGNDTNNALDTGFGYANAALGVFTQYTQQSKFVEGSMLYNQTEFYVQDNWKVTSRLTLDYGMRFVNQQPQYDQFGQESNFFPGKWKASDAQVLYIAGCSNGAIVCTGNFRNAMDPRTGTILTAVGAANTQAAIGTPIPGTGNPLNGIFQAGNGIAKTNYTWPKLVAAPRFGFAYDLTGRSNWVIRGGGGLFYDRPDGNTVFSTPGNPPIATTKDLRNGLLSTLGQGLSPQPVPGMSTFEYNAKIPASLQWQIGIQKSLPWGMVGDMSYVGNHGINRLGGTQNGNGQNLNAVDIGAAYLPKYQDPTLGPSTTPGASAYTSNLLRAFQGLANINEQETRFWDTYHSLQFNVNRRFARGFSFGANYTHGISLKGNTGISQRFQHAADGTISLRSDEAQWEKLNETLDAVPHLFKANAIWNSPGIRNHGGLLLNLTRDWQVSSVATVQSGGTYSLGYSYVNNGGSVNLTGSPDYGPRLTLLNGLGSGCSGDQYAQFNGLAIKPPTYGSLGMESGRNYMRGCLTRNVDMSLVRRIRVSHSERYRAELRADVFNALNTVDINGRNTSVQFTSPTNLTVVNSQYNADGSLNQSRLKPNNAGFGAANSARTLRNIQLQLRFQF